MRSHEAGEGALEKELHRLDDEIAGRREELVAVRAQVLRNDAAIERLLDMVCHGKGQPKGGDVINVKPADKK